MGRVGNRPFVGRDAELDILRDCGDRARRGAGSIVLLGGEAGTGKTRLYEEALLARDQDGIVKLAGHASRDDMGLSMAPIVDSLRSARQGAGDLWRCVARRGRWLSAILPELAPTRPGSGWPGRDRHLVFECLLEAITDAAAGTASVWVLDDMQWADPSTWAFVRHASYRIERLPILLVVAYRTDEGLIENGAGVLAEVAHRPHVIKLRVERLQVRETEKLVRSVAPPGLDPDALSSRVARSGGNPAVAVELAAADAGVRDFVPPHVRAYARSRLATLSPEARRLMEVLAALGGQAEAGLLAEFQPEAQEGALAELLGSGMAALDDGAVVRCDYPLLPEAVYEEIPWSRRRAIHLEVADALGRGRRARGAEVLERARHRELGGAARAAFDELVAAAEEARGQGRAGWAGTLCLTAQELAARHEALVAEQASLAWRTLESLSTAGRWADLLPVARRLWARRASMTLPQRSALAATLGTALLMTGRVGEGWELLRPELARLGARTPAPDRPALVGASAAGLPDERVRDPACARGAPAVGHLTRCIALACSFYDHRDRDEMAHAYVAEARWAQSERCTAAEAFALWNRARMTTEVDQAREAEEIGDDAGSWVGGLSRLLLGALHLLEGRGALAAPALEEADAQLRRKIRFLEPVLDGLQAHLSLQGGDLETARLLLERWQRSGFAGARVWGLIAGATGWLAWEEGDFEPAAGHLAESARQCARTGYGPCESGPLLVPLQVDSLLHLGRPEEAACALRDAVDMHGGGDRFFAAAIALARFRLRPSPAAGLEAERRAAAAPWPFMAGLAACWRAELLDDPAAALAARDRFATIGARGGVERAQALLRRRPRSWRSRSSDVISRRELEVAELIAQGLTNQAIAYRLHLSPHTVGTHVKNLLGKLEFSSRAQVAAWMTHRSHRDSGPQQVAL